MDKKRPKGVTALGSVILLSSLPVIFALLLTGARAGDLLIFLIASPLICIITGVGLLRLKNWARLTTMFLSPILSFTVLGIPSSFLFATIPPAMAWLIIILGIGVISIGIIYYLTRPKVKEQFK